MSLSKTLSLGALSLWLIAAIAACRTDLVHDLDEPTANRIVSSLAQAGIDAEKRSERGGAYVVEVPNEHVADALRVLEDNGLPGEPRRGVETLESGIVPNPAEEQARLRYALCAEVERTLLRIPGIRDARVHLSTAAEASAFEPPERDVRASVFVLYVSAQHSGNAQPFDPEPVQRLVAGAVSGLEVDAVEVVAVPVVSQTALSVSTDAQNVALGPFAVSRRDVGGLRGVFMTLAILILALSALLATLLWRRRRGATPSRAS